MTKEYVVSEKNYGQSYFNNKLSSNYKSYNQDDIYPSFIEYAKGLKKIHPQAKKVLDVGCAKGYFVLAFDNQQCQAYGVDISEYAISHGHPKVKKNLAVLNIDSQKIPYPDKYFDIIVSCEVIEHIANHDFFLKEVYRTLSSEGIVYFTTPVVNTIKPNGEPYDKTHISVFPRQKWLKIFKKNKLVPVSNYKYWIAVFSCVNGMSKTTPGSTLGILFSKLGYLGGILRKALLFFDIAFHYQTDMFVLRKV